MILADTGIWIDYFRRGDATLTSLLNRGSVLLHPSVIGELAVGNLEDRELILHSLSRFIQTALATHTEVLEFIERHRLYGQGIGYVDCHLLAGVMLTPGAAFWTRDRRLIRAAESLGVAATIHEGSNGAKP
jgi:predicted nucleic acid-binding protein